MVKTVEEARAHRKQFEALAAYAPAEIALNTPDAFPVWSADSVSYTAENPQSKVRYGDLLYKCLTSHTSQESWKPDVSPSLWVRIDDPAIEWPEWRQPQGSHDAYPKGAKVSHNGNKWTSDIDANVWEPGVYGWTEYAEPTA